MSNTDKAEEAKIAAVERELAGDTSGAAQATITTIVTETRASGSSSQK